ncbi:MAG: hypothetical protein IKH14_08850 [Prevotella sp.]|nr:hypothetical protein [Prevotella sp.]
MGIFNSNDFDRGYDDGYNAGLNGKEKDYTHMGMSLKFAINGSKALDTYTNGYNKGYEKGIADKNSKKVPQKVEIAESFQPTNNVIEKKYYSPKSKNLSIMSSLQDYQIQLEQLNQLVSFLNQFKETMDERLNEYRHHINVMRENGLSVQTSDRFENDHIKEVEILLNQIKNLIDEYSIPFTRQNIELTENLIQLNSGN